MEARNVKIVTGDGEEIPLGDGIPILLKREEKMQETLEETQERLYGTEAYVNAEKPEEPEVYPTFEVGETIELKGYPFVVMRRNASSLKLKPVPPEGQISAKKTLRKMQFDRLEANRAVDALVEFVNERADSLSDDKLQELRNALGALRTAADR